MRLSRDALRILFTGLFPANLFENVFDLCQPTQSLPPAPLEWHESQLPSRAMASSLMNVSELVGEWSGECGKEPEDLRDHATRQPVIYLATVESLPRAMHTHRS